MHVQPSVQLALRPACISFLSINTRSRIRAFILLRRLLSNFIISWYKTILLRDSYPFRGLYRKVIKQGILQGQDGREINGYCLNGN